MSQAVTTDARELYEPPVIEDIPLRPDEQILAGCKTSPFNGPNVGGGPGTCGSCTSPGSS